MHTRALSLILLALPLMAAAQIRIENLRTEHLDEPLGIDAPQPRFSWQIETQVDGIAQQQYTLIVGTDSAQVASGRGNMWQHHAKSAAQLTRYAGKPLQPQTAYYWQVAVRDNKGHRATSPVACFETGKMGIAHWQGAWISDSQNRDERRAPYFRKTFQLDKPVRSARLYIVAAGLSESFVNGQRVGNHLLDPLYTRFDRRNLYVTHNITPLVRQGKNAVGVVLGNGWYNHQAIGVWDFDRAPWRNRPAFCADIVVTFTDGTTQTIGTDLSWRTNHADLVANNIYTGEQRDFTQVQEGWSMPDFDEAQWRGVGYRTAPSQQITAQQARPIRVDKEILPKTLKQVDSLTWVYDFGQNMAGVTRLVIQGERGTTLHIAHGERIHPDGRLDMRNIDIYYRGNRDTDPFQTDIFTLSGKRDSCTTQTGYKGFRYAQITTSRPMTLTEGNLTALFIHSDVPSVGEIRSSNPLINQLIHAARMSYLSNLMGLPTDCPQREKNGWTGDAHLAIEAGLYNFDGITVYEKWMGDHRDEQQPNGVLPDIIPTCGWGYGSENGLDWTSTIAIIPWNLYLFKGDDTALRQCYDNIKRYVDYVERTSHHLLTTWGRGDWVPVTVGSNKEMTSSIYFYTDARILARAAAMFGFDDDARRYGQLAEDIRSAINSKFFNAETGTYASGTQTEQSMALCWGIVPEESRALVAKRLNEKVVESDYHLNVGVLGCRALLQALCQNGYAETAYKVAVQDSYPSWGYWMHTGATTLLENWRVGVIQDGSDNHMMFGELGAWFYRDLGGIAPDEADPGFHHTLLRPFFPTGLDAFSASHNSPYGLIVSAWRRQGHTVHYTAAVPTNTTATFTIPQGWRTEGNAAALTLAPGIHQITLTQSE